MNPWHRLLHRLPPPCRCGRTGPSPPQSCGCWSTQPSWRSKETQTTWVRNSHANPPPLLDWRFPDRKVDSYSSHILLLSDSQSNDIQSPVYYYYYTLLFVCSSNVSLMSFYVLRLMIFRLTMFFHINSLSLPRYSTANTCLSTLDRPTPRTVTRYWRLWTSGKSTTSSRRRRVDSKSFTRKAPRTLSS